VLAVRRAWLVGMSAFTGADPVPTSRTGAPVLSSAGWLVTLVAIGVGGAAVKGWAIAGDGRAFGWVAIVGIAAVALGAGLVAGTGLPTPADPDGVRSLRLVGVLPHPSVRWSPGRLARVLFALVAMASLLLAVGPVADGMRRSLLAGAAGALVALLLLELRPGERRDHLVLWASLPLVLAAGACALLLVWELAEATALRWWQLRDLVLVVALCEELVFRGGLLVVAARAFHPLRSFLPALATSILFGLWHVGDELGQAVLWVVGVVVGTTLAGLVFTWIRFRTRGVWGPTAAHVATNLPGKVLGL
jgi:membrane protease YdiL (CAAX protease family)